MSNHPSVSATALAKMTYCEASVVRRRRFSKKDCSKINKGNEEHKKYERYIKNNPVIQHNYNDCNVSNNPVFSKTVRLLLTALVITCVITLLYL